jgi:PAS domain S-box-containing protein
MKQMLRILHLEDDPKDAELVRSLLESDGVAVDVLRVDSAVDFARALERSPFDLIISDFTLPAFDGHTALKLALEKAPDVPFIFVSGTIGEESAIESLLSGATDYVLKTRMERLVPAVKRAMREIKERSSRKKAEQALRESESSFRHLFASNPHPMWVYDTETLAFLEVNDASIQKYGYTRDEFLSKRITDLHLSEDVPRLRASLDSGTNSQPRRSTWQHRLKNGSTIDVEVSSHTLTFAGKTASLVVAQDVTERKHAEEALRESEERFRLITENVADLIAVLDLEGKRVYNSPSYALLLGDPAELHGTDSFEEIHPEDRGKIREIFRETVITGKGKRTEYRLVSRDGRIHHIESQGSVIRDREHRIINVLVVGRDVTENKALQEQLFRSQRLESLGTLAGGIAHDLNNVLSPIMLSLGLLKKLAGSESEQKMLETLEASALRGRDIIKQVLTFGRGITADRSLLQPRHIVKETLSIIQETFPKDIEISAHVPGDIWTIYGDATHLHQLLMNLTLNARDAMPHGGKLLISVENLIVDEQYARMNIHARPGRFVMITVEDSGVGMPSEIRDRMFEPFFTTKGQGKGTGLGLSMVHTIVKSHDGFVNVYSEPGKGTTFRVYLPASEADQATVTVEDETLLGKGNGELILLIDDEASICEITKQTLEAYGYRVITAFNGGEAMTLYEANVNEIALVLTDMMMPGMDGPETIRALQELNPSVKIIASSGLIATGGSGDRSDVHVNDFISKPYTAATLVKTVRGVLSQ